MYLYLCWENIDADQLQGYRAADLRLCFCFFKKADFLMTRLIFLGRFNGGNVSDAILNGSSIHIQLDMTSKITFLFGGTIHESYPKPSLCQNTQDRC